MIREFVLWNATKTSSHNFNSNASIITDVSGLGSSFDIVKANNGKSVVGYLKNFEPVTLKINFGVEADAYAKYNDFASFIAENGAQKFILEYKYGNGTTRYADVWFKQLTKSQKTSVGVLEETLTLDRTTYWYVQYDGSVPAYPDGVGITNSVFEGMPVDVQIVAGATGQVEVQLKQGATTISRVSVSINANETLSIYSSLKKIDVTLSGVVTNGYNRTNKTWDSFFVVPKGTYTLTVTSNTSPASAVTYSYRKWGMD